MWAFLKRIPDSSMFPATEAVPQGRTGQSAATGVEDNLAGFLKSGQKRGLPGTDCL